MGNNVRHWNKAGKCIIVRKSVLFWSRVMRFKSCARTKTSKSTLCFMYLCTYLQNDTCITRWDIGLETPFRCFHEIKLKTRHCELPLAIFVCLYQQNLFWYQQDPYIPTGAKLYLQNPKGTHTVSIVISRKISNSQIWERLVKHRSRAFETLWNLREDGYVISTGFRMFVQRQIRDLLSMIL